MSKKTCFYKSAVVGVVGVVLERIGSWSDSMQYIPSGVASFADMWTVGLILQIVGIACILSCFVNLFLILSGKIQFNEEGEITNE